jgi:hypothetical protein
MTTDSPSSLSAELSVSGFSIYREGRSTPLLRQQAQAPLRPYLHPIHAPDGDECMTEDRPAHHSWQHGLYTGLNKVNGWGFWTEGREGDGRFRVHPVAPPGIERNAAHWTVLADWETSSGEKLLTEEQRWSFTDLGSTFQLDLAWSLTAAADLTFGQYEYGGPFLRMPFRHETGAEALNSEGIRGTDSEGQRARWVAVAMPLEGTGRTGGFAIFDHPENPEFPTPWRVDGDYGIAPSRCIAGPWQLARGETARHRFRFLVFMNGIDATWIENQWQTFATGEMR